MAANQRSPATDQRAPTRKALEACSKWLSYCLSIGWEKSTLDRLQEIWWQYHDDQGRLV